MGALGAFEGACLTMWASDVAKEKLRVGGLVEAVQAGLRGQCPGIDTPTLQAWEEFYVRWSLFAREDVPTFAANHCATLKQYEREVLAWDAKIRAVCRLPSPNPNAPGAQGPSGPAAGLGLDPSTIKWAVAGVGLLSVAVVVRTLFK